MKILDRYIIKNFLKTFFFILLSLVLIAVVIDFSQRMHRLEANGGSIKEALIHYYPLWGLWIGNTFMPIIVFISVIFFTSRLSNNSEIIAISSSTISLTRIFRPYLLSAFIIGLISFILNHFILFTISAKKNEFSYKYLISLSDKRTQEEAKKVNIELSKGEYIFIDHFLKQSNYGSKFLYQKFEGQELVHLLSAYNVSWDEEKKEYILYSYNERKIENKKEIYKKGYKMSRGFKVTPSELLPEEYLAENMSTPKLKQYIKLNKSKGGKFINNYLNEYYQRSSLPLSTFILTLLGFSVSSEKKRGGVGLNIALGITLAFIYIFFIEIAKHFSINGHIPSFWALWGPNFIFAGIALLFYKKRLER